MDPNNYQQPGTNNNPVGQAGYSPYPNQPAAPQSYQPAAGQYAPSTPPPSIPVGQIAPVKSNPNSTQNTLQVAEVRDGIIIMNDGSFRAVVMAKSINFDLMSPQEREAVEYSYQGF